MKKYKLTIRGNNYEVDILSIEDDKAEVEVNGSRYEVDIHQTVKKSTKTPILIRTQTTPTGDADTKRTSKPSAPKGAGLIKAPLPGTILEMKCKVGDVVKNGGLILIMEAMKMENNIKTNIDGTITKIFVNAGDSVLEGDSLVEVGGE